MRTLLVLCFILGLTLAVTANGARYVPPPVGRLMLNEILTAEVTAGKTLPVYLDKTGRYYAELILEAPANGTLPVLTAAVPLRFDFMFRRGEKIVWTQTVDTVFAPGERNKTLFWLESPRQLPARQALDMTVRIAAVPQALAGTALRLQLTRKFEMLPPGTF